MSQANSSGSVFNVPAIFIPMGDFNEGNDNTDDEPKDDQGTASLDSSLMFPLIFVAIFLVLLLIFHCVVVYKFRLRARRDKAIIDRVHGQRFISRGVDARSSTCSNILLSEKTVKSSTNSIDRPVKLSNLSTFPEIPRSLFIGGDACVVTHSDPNIHSRTNLRDFTFKPRVVERLRSASLHTGRPSYSDPSMTKHSDLHTNNKPFCGQELYNPHSRARAKSLELFENSRTLSPNTTSRFGTNNTSSVPTIYYIEDSYSQSGSLTSIPNIPYLQNITWKNNELYSPAELTSGVRAPHNSLMISSVNTSTSLGPGLDSDFGASAGCSQRIVSSNNSITTSEDSRHRKPQSDVATLTPTDWHNATPYYTDHQYGYVDGHSIPVLERAQHWV